MGHPRLLSFSPDGASLIVDFLFNDLCTYDMNTGESLHVSKGLHVFEQFSILDVSRDGKEVYADRGIYNLVGPGTNDTDAVRLTESNNKFIDPKHTYYLEGENR